MKIYTKTGDKGETSLIGGVRVKKSAPRIHAYGTVDELNSCIGVVRALFEEEQTSKVLYGIQHLLFTIGSHLAADPEKSRMKLPDLYESDVKHLEKEMDRMNESLPELRHFILPGGHPTVAHCHVARTVCRRAERLVVEVAEEEHVEDIMVRYLNRLSDYLFVLARWIGHHHGAEEVKWLPEERPVYNNDGEATNY